MKRVTRAELRGKRLDDDCKKAYTSSHECGENDNRVFCLGLYDIETDYILDKCWSCRAFADNAKPLLGSRGRGGEKMDLIDRQAAIDEIENYEVTAPDYMQGWAVKLIEAIKGDIRGLISELPSAQPEQKWIPLETRPMDEEERAEWSEKLGYDIEYEEAVIYTSQLPDDGQEVLTCNRYGHITTNKFANDPDYGCFFEKYGEMDGIVAWMPLPEPYEEG